MNATQECTVQFTATQEERKLIRRIVRRGRALAIAHEIPLGEDTASLEMDIEAAHCNGTPLRLEDFLAADDFNFAHDFFGIRGHMDRTTGKLMHCFLPRFYRPETSR